VSGRDKARNTAPGTKGTIKQSARDATGKPHAEEMEQGGPTRAQNVSFWRGSGCALLVMAAAQIRRFCMPASPAEFPPSPRAALRGGRHHQPSPADLARQLGQ